MSNPGAQRPVYPPNTANPGAARAPGTYAAVPPAGARVVVTPGTQQVGTPARAPTASAAPIQNPMSVPSSAGPPKQPTAAPSTGQPRPAAGTPSQLKQGGGSGPAPNTGELRILTRQKLSELAKQIDGDDRLDEDAARIMMILADEFVDSVTNFACKLAKHRKSPTVEVKDVQMHLERNWGIRIAGLSQDDSLPTGRGRKRPLESHKQRLALVKKFKR